MAKKERRRWGDRKDAKRVRELDGMHLIIPMIFPNRTDNEAFVTERIDLTKAAAYLDKLNAANTDGYKFNIFQLIVTTMLRTVAQRPHMNRFICNKTLYHRHEITASFTMKKKFADDAGEGLARICCKPDTTLFTVHDQMRKQVTECKKGKNDSTSDVLDSFLKFPRFVTRIATRFFCFLDRHGWVPSSMSETDPYYASVILSNLGSIKLHSGYHHLSNWGTTSVFVIVGERKMRPFFNEDGSYVMKDSIDLGLTVDERISDGYYFAKTIRLMKYLLENPELLEQTAETPVDFELQKAKV
ncbi:MAG: hypothetical protein E7467_07080 [Ruminococcaceae bacterium]|nr:hypothetical protein [Oscillospiraceae bacterium]